MSIASNARATAIMNKVKGGNAQVFNSRFAGYDEASEGIFAQQREADRKLKLIQLRKQKATA